MNRTQTIFFTIVLSVTVLIFGSTLLSSAQTSAAPYVAIGAGDLSQAGYTQVAVQNPENGLYNPPAFYFWVNGGAKTKNTANLVMVSEYRQDSTYDQALFKYNEDAQPINVVGTTAAQISTLPNDNRVVLNFSKGNYYIVIISPTTKNVQALASIIAAKL